MAVKIRLRRMGQKKNPIDEELAKKWLTNGAQPTDVVAKLLKVAGIEK